MQYEYTLTFIVLCFSFPMSYSGKFKVKVRPECQFQIHYSLTELHINICCVLPEGLKSHKIRNSTSLLSFLFISSYCRYLLGNVISVYAEVKLKGKGAG